MPTITVPKPTTTRPAGRVVAFGDRGRNPGGHAMRTPDRLPLAYFGNGDTRRELTAADVRRLSLSDALVFAAVAFLFVGAMIGAHGCEAEARPTVPHTTAQP